MTLPWKALAKRYSERLGDFMANPGLLLGMLVAQENADENRMAYRAAECLAWVFEGLLRRNPLAKNYIEITMTGGDGRQLFVTVQRPGGKTPAQLYAEAKAELEETKSQLAMATEALTLDLVEYTDLKAKYDRAKADLEARRTLDGMRKCLQDGCDNWHGPKSRMGLPRYCPDHNDLNP